MSKKIIILTDSSSGFNINEEKKYGIYVLPLHIIFNDEKDILDSEKYINDNNFYKKIETETVKTSQSSPGEIIKTYNKLLKKYDEIIYYPIDKKLSGQYNTALIISKWKQYNNKIHVMEVYASAFSLKKLVIYASSLLKNGKNINEIIKETKKFENSTLMAIIPGNIKKLANSGRVKKLLINIINMLKIKILIQWGKNPTKIASSRKIKTLVENFIETLKNFTGTIKYNYELFVLKTSACTSKIWNIVTETLNKEKIKYKIEKLPNVFAVHAGLNTIAFVTIPIF